MTTSPTTPGRLPRRALGVAALVLLACAASGARAGAEEADTPAALFVRYEALGQHDDFGSFGQRMATIRALGRHPDPDASERLLKIVRASRSLDDKVVATMALGPRLTADTARALAEIVARPKEASLAVALGHAFAFATDPGVLAWLAGEALASKHDAVRQAALDAQYIHGDPAAREQVAAIYLEASERESGVDLAYGAVRALGSIGGPQVRTLLLRAAAHEDWRIRLAAADVMASQVPLDVNVRGAVRHQLADPVPVVRQAAVEAVGRARLAEVLPELVALLDDDQLRTRAVAHDALRQLTGKDLGFAAADWIAWWKHRSGGASRPAPSTSVATYYGLNVYTDRVLFILDVSGSMAFPWGSASTRIGVAREELSRVLGKLSPASLFNVIAYSDKVQAWRKGETPADEASVAKALAWIDKTLETPRGGTFMHAALEKAFAENPRVDTIFLLTDGLATDGEPVVPEAILASLLAWNRYRRVVIHTIALTLEELDPGGLLERDVDDIEQFMKRLAAMTGGESRIVTKPPKKP